MTRPKPKESEENVKATFLEFLNSQDVKIVVDSKITDSPDMGFHIDQDFVGCELTTITREELEKWIREKHANEDEFGKIIIENRPDRMMEELLIKKNSKIPDYQSGYDFNSLWLLVHVGEVPLFDNSEFSLQMMKHAINKTPHNFDMIWFLGEKSKVEQLWPILPEHANDQTFNAPTEIIFHKVTVKVKPGVSRIGINFNKKKIIKGNNDLE